MAAIATRKPGAEAAVQLTFPAVYQSVYASQHRPLQYAPSTPGPLVRPMAGDDFQAHYHAQKKADADYMARAKVVSTQNSDRRMLLSHQNYFGMPAPQLAQREFANGSAGAYILNSARRDGGVNAPFQLIESGLTGGVLRTAEGQAYGKARLLARIDQLNRMDAEKAQFLGVETGLAPSTGAPTQTMPTGAVSDNAKIELQLLLEAIIDALMGDTARNPGEKDELSRITFSDSVRALSLIIRVASSPDTDAETLEDVKAPVDQINQLLSGLTDPDRAEQSGERPSKESLERIITTAELFQRLNEYLDQMMGGINRSPRERVALSKNLVKSLGFTKFTRIMENTRVESKGFYEKVSRTNLFDTRGRQEMDDADDDDPDDQFNQPGSRREDTEQGGVGSRATFDEDERQVFGYASGDWYAAPAQQGREAPTYMGEERVTLEELAAPERVLQPALTRQASRTTRPSAEIRGVYDPVLGTRGVEVVRSPAESVAPPRSQRTLPRRSPRRPRVAEVAEVVEERRGDWFPRSREDLPTTRAALDALARQINDAGGLTDAGQIAGKNADGSNKGKAIRVYSVGQLPNIRRNFIRRLGL